MVKQKFTRIEGKRNEIECFFTEIKDLNLFFIKKIEVILIHFFLKLDVIILRFIILLSFFTTEGSGSIYFIFNINCNKMFHYSRFHFYFCLFVFHFLHDSN